MKSTGVILLYKRFLKSYHDPLIPHLKQWKTPVSLWIFKVYLFVLSLLWGFGQKGQYSIEIYDPPAYSFKLQYFNFCFNRLVTSSSPILWL